MTDPNETRRDGDPMIQLEHLSKVYPGSEHPAVTDLSMDIGRGETVVFVGPSGCGKTTTMKLVNRIIEPSSGRIVLEGEDVTTVNADGLRRRIGYAIQQVGLFPHMTIGDNIATVPRMLGWDKQRINDRVDELLTIVGLDASLYRNRYPKQLSGGQQQRVGVARALGADPPVMLMDEPFGAIDPITRENLQNEFLAVQQDIRKTIVFVTHDIDEAIKMGDRIAILRQGAVLAQLDTPERILTEPADEFVADFIGRGASIKRLTLTRVEAVDVDPWPTVKAGDRDAALDAVSRAARGYAVLLNEGGRPIGWLPTDVGPHDTELLRHGLPLVAPVAPEDSLFDALDRMLASNTWATAVVDERGGYRGVLEVDAVRQLIHADVSGRNPPGEPEVETSLGSAHESGAQSSGVQNSGASGTAGAGGRG